LLIILPASTNTFPDIDSSDIMASQECPFCHLPNDRILFENNLAIAFRDGFPVAEGHLLVIPKRHIESWFELKSDERESCHELILNGKKAIKNDDSSVSGFNLGVNDGLSAGQTIFHAHLHLIPRRHGDVENPRGGVRHVIPGKGYY
jgi:diadenosine tetraphosphate (Ap4A) HIT family hydrolase